MSQHVHVVGVGMIPFTKPGASDPYHLMGARAMRAALEDAGLDYSAIQQVYAGYVYGDSCCGQRAVYCRQRIVGGGKREELKCRVSERYSCTHLLPVMLARTHVSTCVVTPVFSLCVLATSCKWPRPHQQPSEGAMVPCSKV